MTQRKQKETEGDRGRQRETVETEAKEETE